MNNGNNVITVSNSKSGTKEEAARRAMRCVEKAGGLRKSFRKWFALFTEDIHNKGQFRSYLYPISELNDSIRKLGPCIVINQHRKHDQFMVFHASMSNYKLKII